MLDLLEISEKSCLKLIQLNIFIVTTRSDVTQYVGLWAHMWGPSKNWESSETGAVFFIYPDYPNYFLCTTAVGSSI